MVREQLPYENGLTERLRENHPEAQEAFLAEFREPILRVVLSMVSDDEAHDIVQQALLVAIQKIAQFKGQSSLRVWVFGIAMTEVKAWRRKRWRRWFSETVSEDPEQDPWPLTTNGLVVREALQKLSHDHSSALVMYEVEGLSVDEIAEVQGVASGTVMSRLFYARKRMRKLLAGFEG